ncbi:MAG: DNA helicase II, partial [Rhodospirillaceae bacterium]|nr:DNA helicase II [Rhodospirillaceae bacterium]
LFPHQRSLDEAGTEGLEEERRLAYVALTRAKKRALVTSAASRRLFGQWQSALPSRFLDELPEQHTERSDLGEAGGGMMDDFTPARQSRRGGARRRQNESVAYRQMDGNSDGTLEIGQRVFHQKFGYGRICALDGDKLEVDFEKAGSKKVMASFVEQV